jgi:vitamin B12 transporter
MQTVPSNTNEGFSPNRQWKLSGGGLTGKRALMATAVAMAVLSMNALGQTAGGAGFVGGVHESEVEEIIVTARSIETTLPIELARYGSDVEFITEEAIKGGGFFDIGQAVEMLAPGVNVTSQAGAFSYVDVSMNGSRSTDVLWTIDGVRINNRLYNSTSPADTLPAAMIERTEVMSGGHGLLYGTQAVAGVMNVVTRSFSDEFGGSVSLGTDSNSGQHHSAYARGTIGNNKLVGWVSKDETDGYEIFDFYNPGATDRKRGYDVESVGLKYGYDFSDKLTLTLTGIHTEAALDYPNPSGTNVNERDEDVMIARLDYAPNDDMQFFIKSYYHDWDTDYYEKSSGPDSSE